MSMNVCSVKSASAPHEAFESFRSIWRFADEKILLHGLFGWFAISRTVSKELYIFAETWCPCITLKQL